MCLTSRDIFSALAMHALASRYDISGSAQKVRTIADDGYHDNDRIWEQQLPGQISTT